MNVNSNRDLTEKCLTLNVSKCISLIAIKTALNLTLAGRRRVECCRSHLYFPNLRHQNPLGALPQPV